MNKKLKLAYYFLDKIDNSLAQDKYKNHQTFFRNAQPVPNMLKRFMRGRSPNLRERLQKRLDNITYKFLNKLRTFVLSFVMKYEKKYEEEIVIAEFKNKNDKDTKASIRLRKTSTDSYLERQNSKMRGYK
jgi:hypothetical protein